jgi:hypothetical protein
MVVLSLSGMGAVARERSWKTQQRDQGTPSFRELTAVCSTKRRFLEVLRARISSAWVGSSEALWRSGPPFR